jgi:hypothetical protein
MDLIKIEKERPNSFRLWIGNLKNFTSLNLNLKYTKIKFFKNNRFKNF